MSKPSTPNTVNIDYYYIDVKLFIYSFISLRLLGNPYEISHFTIALSDTEYIFAIDVIQLFFNNCIIYSLLGRSTFLLFILLFMSHVVHNEVLLYVQQAFPQDIQIPFLWYDFFFLLFNAFISSMLLGIIAKVASESHSLIRNINSSIVIQQSVFFLLFMHCCTNWQFAGCDITVAGILFNHPYLIDRSKSNFVG